ncbi:peptidase [Kitasatospora sp. NPDC059577]|uniref:peptidase n=1 Tax=Kitasatospora sp. NPDC059577 TaxID=3346873 RepID=UPI00367E6053
MKGARRYWVLLLMLAFVQAAGVMPAAGHEAPAASSPQDPAADRTIAIKLLDAPENRRADPRAHAYIIDHLAPGSTIERRVEITNRSSTPMHVKVYAAAATIAKGEFTFAPQRTPDELTGWTSFDAADLELAASETARVRTTVRVPGDAAAGERYGVIWAQTAAPTDRSHTLTVLGRVGVRMYIDVGPGDEPPSDFTIERLYPARARDGRGEVRARIHNTGGRALDISGTLSLLDGPGGQHTGPFSTGRTGATLAPGDSGEVVVPLDATLPNGPWTGELALRSGLVEHTTRATITFPSTPGSVGADAASAALQGDFPTSVVAWLSALALAALCLLLSRFLRRRR